MNSNQAEQQRFQELINECNHLLAAMDTLQLNALIERFSAEIDSRRTLNYLVDGPSLLACLIARHVVRPDNLTALIAMAEVANRSDIKQSIDRYYYPSTLSSHQASLSVIDDGISNYSSSVLEFSNCNDDLDSKVFVIVSSSIEHDWRNLARKLGLPEQQISNIDSTTYDHQTAALQVTLSVFPVLK